MLTIVLLTLGILAIIGETILIILWISARWIYRKPIIPKYFPKTCVIVPCKGTSEDFKENIKAICSQNYKDYTLIFVTDSTQDPAYIELQQILQTIPNARIELAEHHKECSGKIAALLKGIKTAGDVEVYVFADSDIKPHKEWLRNLVANLNEKNVGVATGFRWYFFHDLQSLLLSTWNLASILFLFHNSFNYAWGGSTAIKKQVFEKLKIETKWKQGFSDDLILTNAVKQAGYKINFVPKCILESFDDANLKTLFKWSTTQYTWVKWYYPSIWAISFIGLVGLKTLTILGFVLILAGHMIPGLLMVSTIFFEFIYGWIGFSTCRKTMWYPKKRYGFGGAYACMMPCIFFLLAYNILASLFTKELTWKGRKYKKS